MARISDHWEYLKRRPKTSVSARNNTNRVLACVQAGVFPEEVPVCCRTSPIPLCNVVIVASAG